jgi:hypothetical protein
MTMCAVRRHVLIAHNAPQVEEATCEAIRPTEKGNLYGNIACRRRGEPGNRLPACRPKAWMRWVKLNCLKSNGKLETEYSLDTTVTVKTWRQQPEIVGL